MGSPLENSRVRTKAALAQAAFAEIRVRTKPRSHKSAFAQIRVLHVTCYMLHVT